jgi:opacity protein-like surface antigen
MDTTGRDMGRRSFALLLAAVGIGSLTAVSDAATQVPLSVEVRAEAAFPRGALDERWGVGVGFGVSATIQLVPNYGLYGGYSRTTFDHDADAGLRAVGSGSSIGLTRAFPVAGLALVPWVGSGLLIHDLRIEGAPAADGDSQLGFEVGGGVAVALTPNIRLTPGIGYRQYGARILGAERETVQYFSAGVGLNVGL